MTTKPHLPTTDDVGDLGIGLSTGPSVAPPGAPRLGMGSAGPQAADVVACLSRAVVATDLGGRITVWNGQAEELFGWPAAQVVGRDAGEVLGSLDPALVDAALVDPALVDPALGEAIAAAEAASGSLALLDPTGRTVEVFDAIGYPSDVMARFSRFSVHEDIPLAECIRTGRTIVLSDPVGWAARYPDLAGVSARPGACIPLVFGARCRGAIGLSFDYPQSFDRDQVTFFDALGQQFASALERMNLHEQTLRLLRERTRMARSFQASLLPPRLPDIPGLELAARYVAAGEGAVVGCDFYDAVALGSGRWLLAIGDVQGTGIEAAAVTGLARYTLRAVAMTGATPAEILGHLNDVLLAEATAATDETGDQTRFCTVAAAIIEPGDDGAVVTLALAGHPQPLVARSDGTVEAVGRPGMLAGLFDGAGFSVEDQTFRLAPTEVLVLFTDGVTERHQAERFFEDQMTSILAGNRDKPAAELAMTIEDAVRDFVPGNLSDDMALLVVQFPRPVVGGRAVGTTPGC